jgi:hypothetical protein
MELNLIKPLLKGLIMKKLLLITSLLSVGCAFGMQVQDQALAQHMVGFVSDELNQAYSKSNQARDLECKPNRVPFVLSPENKICLAVTAGIVVVGVFKFWKGSQRLAEINALRDKLLPILATLK